MTKPYWNAEAETLAPAALRALHTQKLHTALNYVATHSKFYQAKFAAAGVAPNNFATLEDLARFPFTEKSELRESQLRDPPFGEHRACASEEVRRVYSTSGTTGRPTYIGLTTHDIAQWREVALRAFWASGLRPGAIIPVVVSPFVVAASYADAFETVGTCIPIGVNMTDRLIDAFRFARANTLLCTASYPLHFAAALQQRGIDPKTLGLKLIFAGGEPGASIPSVRQQIEGTFACRMLEVSGNGDYSAMAWGECEQRLGMHFCGQGLIHPELIEPDTGRVIDIVPGAQGELVCTSLDRECIPLVRFRTRDHVVVTHTACACGRTGFGIRIIGRTDDMLIVRGVNVYPSAVRDVIASFAPQTTGVIEIQLHKPPPEGWEPPLQIKAEHSNSTGVDKLVNLKNEIEAKLREKLIFRAELELVPEGSLPRYEYKAKLVRKVYEA